MRLRLKVLFGNIHLQIAFFEEILENTVKSLSVRNDSVGLRTSAAGNVDAAAAIVVHVARIGRSRIDAVICN